MQSGTILHLALLKKLSSHYPHNDYHYRFDIFKKQRTTLCTRSSQRHNYPKVNFQKYEEKEKKMLEQIKSQKQRKIGSIKKIIRPDVEEIYVNQDITGWHMDNIEEIPYFDIFKCNKAKIISDQPLQHKRSSKEPINLAQYFNMVQPKFRNTVRISFSIADTQKHFIKDIQFKKKESNPQTQKRKKRMRIKQKQNMLLIEGNFSLPRANSSQEKCNFSMMGQRFNSTVLKRNTFI